MSNSVDVENLKNLAASRRNGVATSTVETPGWHCHYCDKNFVNESVFMNHFCKERERHEELRSPIGQAAYGYYSEWMRLYKRKAPPIDTFATSRFYTSFVKFAKHVIVINLPSPEMFIRLMSERDISPMLWCRDQCYSIYLEFYDKSMEPLEQVKNSIVTLMDIAERESIELTNIFVHLGPHRVTELLRLRQLSPWFIFCSAKFGDFLKTLPQEDWAEMSKIINPTYWADKLESNKKLVADIIEISNGIGL